jgi:multisubunit Na+/H+ antiporter MnhC subunit
MITGILSVNEEGEPIWQTTKHQLAKTFDNMKTKLRKNIRFIINIISLLIIGFGVGWLAGLAVSPVVSTIITSIIGVAVALISALSGLKTQAIQSEEKANTQPRSGWHVDPVPIALLILGIVFGSILGISVRSRNWLGTSTNLRSEIQRWKDVGVDEKEVAQRLFDLEYPPKEISKDSGQTDIRQSVLFGQAHKECERLLSYSRTELPMQLTISPIGIFNDLPSIIQNPEILEKVVETQCKKLGQ